MPAFSASLSGFSGDSGPFRGSKISGFAGFGDWGSGFWSLGFRVWASPGR